ncbi:MAG: hypothetical protein AAB874_02935, partial [Patescibacteria group bacterium]
GINKLTQHASSKNFVISLDYVEGSIEKVSYNIEGNKFNLVIEPRAGFPDFDEKKVSYKSSGFKSDLVITIAAPTLESLGSYFTENQSLFQEKPIVTFAHQLETQYGKINLVQSGAAISEIIANVIKAAQFSIDPDIASNLYDGIISGSRNFSATFVTPETLETAAWLMRQGARRIHARQEEMPTREMVSGTQAESPQAPPDWLKPKIYSGKTSGPSLL